MTRRYAHLDIREVPKSLGYLKIINLLGYPQQPPTGLPRPELDDTDMSGPRLTSTLFPGTEPLSIDALRGGSLAIFDYQVGCTFQEASFF